MRQQLLCFAHTQVKASAVPLQELAAITEPSAADRAKVEDAEKELTTIATFAKLALASAGKDVPAALTDLIITLHDEALLKVGQSPSVQDAVVKLCSDYWLAEAPNANAISVQMVRPLAYLPHAPHRNLVLVYR